MWYCVQKTKSSSLKHFYFEFLSLFCFVLPKFIFNICIMVKLVLYILLFYFKAEECNKCIVIKITNIVFDYNIV